MTENLEARARSDGSPAWQRNSPKDNIPDLTRRGARQPQDGIARGDVPARERARRLASAPRAAARCVDAPRRRARTGKHPRTSPERTTLERNLTSRDRTGRPWCPGRRARATGTATGSSTGSSTATGTASRSSAARRARPSRPPPPHPHPHPHPSHLHHLRIQGMVGQGWQDRPKHHRRTRRRRAPLLRPHLQHLLRLLTPRCHVLVV